MPSLMLSWTTTGPQEVDLLIGRPLGVTGAGKQRSLPKGGVMAHDRQLPQEDLSLSTSGGAENRKKSLAKLALVLAPWFQKWADAFPSHEVTKLQMATYLEALDDFTPGQLEIGCKEATRRAEQFPKPGHIRSAFYAVGWDEQRHERPAYLDDPPLSAEEREEGARYSQAFRELLAEKDAEMAAAKKELLAEQSTYNIDEHLKAYKKWLQEQVARDIADQEAGLSPIPRSEVERLAMYLSLPLVERRRMAKSGEWTKLLTKNT